jgi:hypothetical protein
VIVVNYGATSGSRNGRLRNNRWGMAMDLAVAGADPKILARAAQKEMVEVVPQSRPTTVLHQIEPGSCCRGRSKDIRPE